MRSKARSRFAVAGLLLVSDCKGGHAAHGAPPTTGEPSLNHIARSTSPPTTSPSPGSPAPVISAATPTSSLGPTPGMVPLRAASWVQAGPATDLTPPDPQAAVALSSRLLVVAAGDGLWRSSDAGRSWKRTLPSRAAVAYAGLNRAGSGVVATLSVVSNGPTGRTNADLYFSNDGLSWRRVTPRVTGFGDNHSLAFPTIAFDGTGPASHGVAFAIDPNPAIATGPLLHSDNGGRSWRPVAGLDARSAGVQAVAFVLGTHTAVAAVSHSSGQCSGSLERSNDDGASWQPDAVGCSESGISALTFVDGRRGYAAGDQLLVTDDGGRTWSRRKPATAPVTTYQTYAQLSIGQRDGSVLAGACSASRDLIEEPCRGEIWFTRDGGRTRADTKLAALQVSSAADTLIAVGGPTTPPGLSVSTNAGLTWTRVVAPGDVHIHTLSGPADQILAQTNGLSAVSSDGGRTWRRAAAQVPDIPYQLTAQAGEIVLRAVFPNLQRSSDGGRTWTTVHQPATCCNIQFTAIAFDRSDPSKVVALASDAGNQPTQVLTSSDAGKTWRHASTVTATANGPASYDGHTIVFAGSRLEISHDDGHHFTRSAAGNDGFLFNSSGVLGTSIWATGFINEDVGPGEVLVTHSPDGGRSWTYFTLAGIGLDLYDRRLPDVLPLSADEALLALNTGALLRTTDGGHSWRQEVARLPVT